MFRLVRRAFELVVLLFAAYAFVMVPLGEKTGLEHVQAILSTPEAQDAGDELQLAGERMLSELISFETPPYRGTAKVPTLNPPSPKSNKDPEEEP